MMMLEISTSTRVKDVDFSESSAMHFLTESAILRAARFSYSPTVLPASKTRVATRYGDGFSLAIQNTRTPSNRVEAAIST